MIAMLKDSDKQEQFIEDGYTKFSLLSREDIKEIKSFYYEYEKRVSVQNTNYGMYVSLDEKDLTLKKEVISFIQNKLTPKLNNHLDGFKVHLGGFLIKKPDSYSYTYPHQDWTFVDNEDPEAFSATVWISLDDLKPENGSLGFIKGSHNFLNQVVGSPSPIIKTLTQGHEQLLFEYLEFPETSAGDALMFNNKCVHAANPNTGDYPRIAIGIGITPMHASLYHYFLQPNTNDTLLKMKVNEDFFIHYMNDDLYKLYSDGLVPDKCTIIDKIKIVEKKIEHSDLLNKIIEYNNKPSGYNLCIPSNEEDVVVDTDDHVVSEEDTPELENDLKKSFFKTYTPMNIYREIKHRITGR